MEAESTHSGRILVADDDPVSLRMLQHILQTAGFQVECVEDGQAALIRLGESPETFDVVITDHEMPHLNGLDLVRELTWRGLFAERIVVLSAVMTAEARFGYHELPVHSIYDKPIRAPQLLAACHEIVARLKESISGQSTLAERKKMA